VGLSQDLGCIARTRRDTKWGCAITLDALSDIVRFDIVDSYPMETLALLSGTVSHLNTVSTTIGGGAKSGSIQTHHTALFRVDGKPARFRGVANLANGDVVTLVGYHRTDFDAVALKNESAGGAVYRDKGARSVKLFGYIMAFITCPACFLLGDFWLVMATSGKAQAVFLGLFVFFTLGGVSALGFGLWTSLHARSVDRQIRDLLSS